MDDKPFRVIVWLETGRYRTIGRFATFIQAYRACRRAWFKYHAGKLRFRPEVTMILDHCYLNLAQPTTTNYGRRTFDEDGYETSFTPIHVRSLA